MVTPVLWNYIVAHTKLSFKWFFLLSSRQNFIHMCIFFIYLGENGLNQDVLGWFLLRLAQTILAKSLIKLLGTELLIVESLVLLGVDWINLLHLFKRKTHLFNSGPLPLKSGTSTVVCIAPIWDSQTVFVLQTLHSI